VVAQTAAWRGLRPVAKALGALVGADVEARHRLARLPRQLPHDPEHRRVLRLGDRAGVHGAQGELVGAEVRVAVHRQRQREGDDEPGAAEQRPGQQHQCRQPAQ
jgi:hypothetical protein